MLLLAEPAFALDPARPLRQYVHDLWMTDAGLPQATIKAILQTRDGYLWLGTEEGLARFDGVRFVVFHGRTEPAFREDHVTSLLEDRAGNLWIGTHGGGLVRYRDGAFTAFDTSAGLPTDFVYALHEDRAGTVWVGARRGIVQVRGGRLVTNSDPVIGGRTIWSIREDRSGVMWLGTDLYGLVRIERGRATRYTRATGLPHDAIPVITELRDGRLILGTNGAGLYQWSGGRFVPFPTNGALPSGAITALREDAAGNLWVGTTAGLVRIRDGVVTSDAPGELRTSPIHALAEDAEGSLWIGTGGAGLHRLRDGKAYTITSADGLPSDKAQVVLHDRRGGMWVGTRNGAAHLADGKVTTYTAANGLPNASVRSLFQSADGAIWLGTELGGVARIAGDRVESAVLNPDVPDNTIRAFAEEPGVGVWAGSNGGRLTLFAGGDIARRIESHARRFFVRAMAADKSGGLWIATDGNGLVRLIGDKVRRIYTRKDGLSRDSLRSLYLDGDGTVWIGTDGAGLNRLKDGKITVYRTSNGLFNDRILQILEGDDGRLWMSSNNGIFAVDKRALEAFAERRSGKVQSLFIDQSDGMLTHDCSGGSQPAGAKHPDGTLWFPTDAGVTVVDPRRLAASTHPHPPPVHIERVIAEHTPVAGRDSFEIPKGTRNLEIAYTALSLAVPERVRFRYRLEGYDEHWIDAGDRRTAYYTALPPGQYRFRVIAANDDGVWNMQGATASLSLAPYFYQRRSFAVLVLALIAAAIWAAVTARIRHIRREAARTAEMERRLVLAQRMDALGQLASGIAHDFNNTLMAAYPWAELIRRQYPSDAMLQRAANNIAQAVERAKKVTSQLLDFAQPKPPEVTPFDLGDLAHDQISLARSILPPEIDIHLATAGNLGITGDEGKIGQVLLNLLLNAADAMPKGGRITVEVRERQADQTVLLSVSDTGTGIAPDVIPRIFDPFYTTKGVGKGTGLGLAVVHRIIQDHHGSVHVESEPGKGTTFSIVLPHSEIAVRKPEPAAPETAKGALRGRNILLVDDEAVTIEVVKHMLGMEGATVRIATSGREALDAVDADRPDLVVLDLGLPDIPGDEVHARLRARLRDLPIIIASGYGDRERLDPLLADPHTAYLQKPYRMNALIEVTERMGRGEGEAQRLTGS